MNVQQLMKQTEQTLSRAGIQEAGAEAFWLLSFITGYDRSGYLLHGADLVPEDKQRALFELVKERCAHKPLQYLTGEAPFGSLLLQVNEKVLIPRFDTECLLKHAKDLAGERTRESVRSGEAVRLLDLCTGSGCIALAMKAALPNLDCAAADLSGEALEVARENARRLGLKVAFFQGDLFAPFKEGQEKFHLIVSNPPYIPTDVIATLDPEVREHEPVMALDGGADGLDFYRRIAREAPGYMGPGGALLLEIGSDQAEAVCALLGENGFSDLRVHPDLSGRDRVVEALWKTE